MTKRLLALCGDAPRYSADHTFDQELTLRQTAPDQNVDLVVTNITASIVQAMSAVSRDLLDIAAYVYVLDSSKGRGGEADIYGRNWARDFTVRIPVRRMAIWDSHRIQLEHLLAYLTDDTYRFDFVEYTNCNDADFFEFESYDPFPGADCVCLFSGGADSLAGVVKLATTGRRPLLVSHRSVGILDRRQRDLQSAMTEQGGTWRFPHISVWAHRRERAKSHSQRSRSFLYLSIAATIAYELNLDHIFLPENGVVSLNLPKLAQALGARASRSTHPRFVAEFQALARSLFQRRFRINNPFIFCTKAEVLRELRDTGHAELLELSVSCAHTRGRTKAMPHCGDCSQCVDRRFAAEASDLETYDPKERYERDIFWHDLQGAGRRQVEAHLRLARQLETMDADEFFISYREATEAVHHLPGTTSEAAAGLYELHQRFASETLAVVERQIVRQAPKVARGEHGARGLLSLLADSRLKAVPAAVAAAEITRIMSDALPLCFQSSRPDSERELQDAMEAILKSAEQRLEREGPAVAYSLVRTIPDFAMTETDKILYIEVKLVKNRDTMRYAIKSIAESSSYYVDQGAYVLFLVYDTNRHIVDDLQFKEPFERKTNVQVAIVR